MSFDWTSDDRMDSPKIPGGIDTPVKIVKVLTRVKGEPMASKNGDPQIYVIFGDDQKNETMVTLTLSEKAGFKLRQILRAANANLEAMNNSGVTLEHFTYQEFVDKHLVGRRLLANFKYDEKGFADITPLMSQPGQQPAAAPRQAAAQPPAAPRKPAPEPVAAGFNPESDVPF